MTAEWMAAAACRDYDPEWFFPGEREYARKRAAIAICQECTVLQACLEATLRAEGQSPSGQRHGIAGGLTPTQRARRPRTPVVSIEHGTDLGYRQHHRAGTPACPSCIEGNAVVRRARKARKAMVA